MTSPDGLSEHDLAVAVPKRREGEESLVVAAVQVVVNGTIQLFELNSAWSARARRVLRILQAASNYVERNLRTRRPPSIRKLE
jgi:hypothetical protein